MIAQTVALAALHFGLATCIMSMVTYWPEVYREKKIVPDNKLIAFGIAIGYPEMEARVNTFTRTREPLDTFVHWYGV
jgi:nitroreductase